MLCSKRRSHVPCLMADSMLGSSEQYRYTLKRMACHLPVCILLFCGSAAVATWAAPAQHRYNLPDDRSLAIGQSAQLVYHLAGRCWPTQFILILNRIKAGQGNTAGELERLETKAQDEGFVDVLLGSNCYTSAVRSVKQDCNAMDSDSSMWLAFSMANCLFAKTGRHTYPYFQSRAEGMLNNLFATGFAASEQVALVQEAVRQQAAAVVDLGSSIGSVSAGQQQLMQDMSESMTTVTQLHEVTQNVEQGMRDSQAVHKELLESERSVAQKLSTLEALHSEHTEAVRKTWQMVEDQAQWYMEWQGDSLALHSKITESATAMAHASEGIRTATDLFETAQHRSQNALAVLVGRQFSRNDALFAAGSIIVFVALGWHHATQQKRLAFVVSVLLTVGLERSILACLAPWQKLGANGAAILEIPAYLSWLRWWCGSPAVEQLKSWVRISTAACMLVVLLHALWVHQDAPQMLQRVLAKVEHLERQQAARWNMLQAQLLHMLQSLRDVNLAIPAEAMLQAGTDAAEIAARRKQEQLRLEVMWQEALSTGQTAAGEWNPVSTPLNFLLGSSPLTHMDTSTPLLPSHLHAMDMGNSAGISPEDAQAATASAQHVQIDRGVGSRAKATQKAVGDTGKNVTPVRALEGKRRQKAVQQQSESGGEAGGPRMKQVGGSKKLKVEVGQAAADADTAAEGERSPRRSPRGPQGPTKRVGEHNEDEQAGSRREKKLKVAQ